MITLTIGNNAKLEGVEINNNGKRENIGVLDLGTALKKIRLGTTITVKNENSNVRVFNGKYYILFMEEFEEVIIFYQDTRGGLRQVFTDNEIYISKALHSLIADGTQVKMLKSNNKKAYRVVCVDDYGNETLITKQYKNKSSGKVVQTYLDLFTAIKYATLQHSKNPNREYRVITPKSTILYQVG